ncbi:MAG: cation transporter [Deltaproteobacteria bacterium]|nr:cation transporter [Deltaproteobacteria bacterium]
MTSREEKRVIYLGMAINLVLIIAKLAAGLYAASLALVADGIHSLADLATDVIVLWGLRLAARPADRGHPYGHGKLETLTSLLVAGLLFLVGFAIVKKALACLLQGPAPLPDPYLVLAVAGLSLIGKEFAYRQTIRVGEKLHSPALRANAWHHRSDALSSLVVVLGVVAGRCGWPYGDPAAGLAVGLMIAWVAFRLTQQDLGQLVESAVDPEVRTAIEEALAAYPGGLDWHGLRARQVGREVNLDFHLLVDEGMSVAESHALGHRLEEYLRQRLPYPIRVMIHMEPAGGRDLSRLPAQSAPAPAPADRASASRGEKDPPAPE